MTGFKLVRLLSYFKKQFLQLRMKAAQNEPQSRANLRKTVNKEDRIKLCLSFHQSCLSGLPILYVDFDTSIRDFSPLLNVLSVAPEGVLSLPSDTTFDQEFISVTQMTCLRGFTGNSFPKGFQNPLFFKCICSSQTFGCPISPGLRMNS